MSKFNDINGLYR
jgi:hypothetical protein